MPRKTPRYFAKLTPREIVLKYANPLQNLTCISSCDLCTDCSGTGTCLYKGNRDLPFDINVRSSDGKTPLMIAIQKTETTKEQIGKLIKLGAKVNVADDKGNTPFLLAVAEGRSDIVELLSQKGANPRARNHVGLGAVQMTPCYDPRIFPLLRSLKLKLTELRPNGTTVMFECLRLCKLDALKFLRTERVKLPKNWRDWTHDRLCPQARPILGDTLGIDSALSTTNVNMVAPIPPPPPLKTNDIDPYY